MRNVNRGGGRVYASTAAVAFTLYCVFAGVANGQPCAEWDVTSDFRVHPGQENPSRDRCGSSDVWFYMESDPHTFPAHVPSSYVLLNEFIDNAFGISGLQQWQGPVISNGPTDKLPAVGVNNTGSLQTPRGIVWNPGIIRVHPSANKLVIVGWKSQTNGVVSVSGSVTDLDNICGNGVDWYIDRFDGTLNTTLASGTIGEGGSQRFENGVGGASLTAVTVDTDDFIYVIVDPKGSDHRCDSTALGLVIRPAVVVSTVPAVSPAILFAIAMSLAIVGAISLGNVRAG